MIALVDPPIASTVVIALRNDASVRRSDGFRSSHAISTMRRPVAEAMTACGESAAGIDAAPGSVNPSASAALVIVDAVPIVMQWPGDRALPWSISPQSCSVLLPARSSAQYFRASEREPRGSAFGFAG